jgi:nucleosome binding factor SPN SPT16 subunit
MKTPLGIIAAAVAAYFFVSLGLFPIPAWAVASVSSPKTATVKKYLESCQGKPATEAGCDKIRKDTIEILKEDLLTLGSSADRGFLLSILPVFKSDEPELRIAAADAIGMIGPEDRDADLLALVTNDPVPDVRQAVAQMISHGKGSAISLLGQRIVSMRTGLTPETPADAAKFNLPVAADSTYLFDSSDASVGRLSYIAKGKNDPAQFYKTKAKKGPFKLDEFKEKYRYQLQDEQEALNQAQEEEAKQLEKVKPPDPTNMQAFMEYMGKMQSLNVERSSRMFLDSYQPTLYGAPTVYVLEERQIGQRTYPTRYVVLYQEQALRKPGYRLSWMTVPDNAIKTAQAASLVGEMEEEGRKKEDEASKKRGEALDNLIKKKDAQEKSKFKKGQADLEKELGF